MGYSNDMDWEQRNNFAKMLSRLANEVLPDGDIHPVDEHLRYLASDALLFVAETYRDDGFHKARLSNRKRNFSDAALQYKTFWDDRRRYCEDYQKRYEERRLTEEAIDEQIDADPKCSADVLEFPAEVAAP